MEGPVVLIVDNLKVHHAIVQNTRGTQRPAQSQGGYGNEGRIGVQRAEGVAGKGNGPAGF